MCLLDDDDDGGGLASERVCDVISVLLLWQQAHRVWRLERRLSMRAKSLFTFLVRNGK